MASEYPGRPVNLDPPAIIGNQTQAGPANTASDGTPAGTATDEGFSADYNVKWDDTKKMATVKFEVSVLAKSEEEEEKLKEACSKAATLAVDLKEKGATFTSMLAFVVLITGASKR